MRYALLALVLNFELQKDASPACFAIHSGLQHLRGFYEKDYLITTEIITSLNHIEKITSRYRKNNPHAPLNFETSQNKQQSSPAEEVIHVQPYGIIQNHEVSRRGPHAVVARRGRLAFFFFYFSGRGKPYKNISVGVAAVAAAAVVAWRIPSSQLCESSSSA